MKNLFFIISIVVLSIVTRAQTLNVPFASTILSNGISARGNSLFAAGDNQSYWWVHTLEHVETFTEGSAGVVAVQKWSNSGDIIAEFILSSTVLVFDVDVDAMGNVVLSGVYMDNLSINNQLVLTDENTWSNMNNFVLYINSSGTQFEAWNMDVFSEYGFSYPVVTFGINNEIFCAGSDYMTGWIYRWNPEEQPQLWLSGSELKVFGDIEVNNQGQLAFASACFQGQVSVGDQIFTAPNSYNVIIGILDSNTNCIGIQFIPDITIQFAEVEWLANGQVLAAGDWFNGGSIGSFELQSPQWVYSYFICEMESNGNVTWATTHPVNPNGITGDFEIARRQSICVADNGEFYLLGKQRGDVYWTSTLQTLGANEEVSNEYSGTLIHWQNHQPVSAQMIHGGAIIEMDQVSWNSGHLAVSGTNEYSDTLYCNDIIVSGLQSAFTFLFTSNNIVDVEHIPNQQNLDLVWEGGVVVSRERIGDFFVWNSIGLLMKSGHESGVELDLEDMNLPIGCYLIQTERGNLKFMMQ